MTTPAIETGHRPSLYGLATDAYRQHEGRTTDAIEAVMATLAGDPVLFQTIVSDAVRAAAAAALNQIATRRRRAIVQAAATPSGMTRASVIMLATGLAAGLLDFPLATGLPLRMATRDDLTVSINRYSAQSASLSRNTEWLRHVLQSVPDGKTVGEVLSEERLKELLAEVTKS